MSPNRRSNPSSFKRLRLFAGLALLSLMLESVAIAAWAPESDEWATIRAGTTHTGETSLTSVFTAGPGGPAQVKWFKNLPYPDWPFPPNVADLNRDGIPEIITTASDVIVTPPPDPPNFEFSHRVEVFAGPDGTSKWAQEETNSFAVVNGPNAMDVDGTDNNAEVLYFAGNPLTGTSATNGLVARAGESGAQQWKFSDSLNWNPSQQVLGVLTAAQGANVDADPTNEAVLVVTLANLTVQPATGTGDPVCDKPRIEVKATNINSRIHALNGAAQSASNSWTRAFSTGLIASTPVIADLNKDGKNEVVFGVGTPVGPLIGECGDEVFVSVDQSAFGNKVIAINGANPPNSLFEFSLSEAGPPAVDRAPSATPVLAGTTAAGYPIIAMLAPIPESAPDAGDDYNLLIALAWNGTQVQELWRQKLSGASLTPLAVADLDGDGQPEIVAEMGNRIATFRNRDGSDFWSQGLGEGRGIVYARGLSSTGPAVADIDSDGTKEIVTILDGRHNGRISEVLVINGATGAVEWTTPIMAEETLGGPVIADVDGDDNGMAEIVVGSGSLTVTDSPVHTGRVTVFEPNAPDLTITAVRHVGNRYLGSPQMIEADVKNIGTRDVSGASFRLSENGTAVGADQIADLAAGETKTLTFPWTPGTTGSRTLAVGADPAVAVQELVETNNQTSTSVNVIPAPTIPVITSPAEGAALNTTTVSVSGTAAGGQTVKLYDNGTFVGQTTANASGSWAHTASYAEGAHSATAIGLDGSGNESVPSPARHFTVDVTAPGEPVITAPPEGVQLETSTVAVSGIAEPLALIRLYEGQAQIGTTTADEAGMWSHTRNYTEGAHSVQATATDNAGNVSLRSAARTFVVDTGALAPVVLVPSQDAFLNSSSVTISGTAEPGAAVTVEEGGVPVGSGIAAADGTWAIPGTFLEGSHTITAVQTDVYGHISPPALRNFTIDLTPPEAAGIINPADGSTLPSVNVTVSGTAEPNATVKVHEDTALRGTATADASGNWTMLATFTEGPHTITALAADRAGNPGPPSNPVSFTVTLPPAPQLTVAITSPGEGSFQPTTFAVGGTAQSSVTQVLVYDNGVQVATLPAAGGSWSGNLTLPSGLHKLTARGKSGPNVGPVSNTRTVNVDGVAPRLTISKPPGYVLFQVVPLFPTVNGTSREIQPYDSGIARIELVYTDMLSGMVHHKTTLSCAEACKSFNWSDRPILGVSLYGVTAVAYDKVGNRSAPASINIFSLGWYSPV